MTQFWLVVGLPVILGLIVNEACDAAPWLAKRIVTRAAPRWALGNNDRAEMLSEEWASVIEECPGKLTKLLLALRFLVGACMRSESSRFHRFTGRLRSNLTAVLLNNPDYLTERAFLLLTVALLTVLIFAPVLGLVSVAPAATAVVLASGLELWRLSDQAALFVRRHLEAELTPTLRAAKNSSNSEGMPKPRVQPIGDGFVIFRCSEKVEAKSWVLKPGFLLNECDLWMPEKLESLELWDPETAAFVPFLDVAVVPVIGHAWWRFATSRLDEVRLRAFMHHAGLQFALFERPGAKA